MDGSEGSGESAVGVHVPGVCDSHLGISSVFSLDCKLVITPEMIAIPIVPHPSKPVMKRMQDDIQPFTYLARKGYIPWQSTVDCRDYNTDRSNKKKFRVIMIIRAKFSRA